MTLSSWSCQASAIRRSLDGPSVKMPEGLPKGTSSIGPSVPFFGQFDQGSKLNPRSCDVSLADPDFVVTTLTQWLSSVARAKPRGVAILVGREHPARAHHTGSRCCDPRVIEPGSRTGNKRQRRYAAARNPQPRAAGSTRAWSEHRARLPCAAYSLAGTSHGDRDNCLQRVANETSRFRLSIHATRLLQVG